MTTEFGPFILGEINGHAIQLVVSNSSCFAGAPQEVQAESMHLIGTPVEKFTMADGIANGITRGKIQDLLDEKKTKWVQHFFPGVDPDTLGVRGECNDKDSAKMDTVHVHAEVSPAKFWKANLFRRCVDPIYVGGA
jgi:hypothetical protein